MAPISFALSEFKKLRRKLKVTQAVLARNTGLSQSYIAELENGTKLGSPAVWGKLLWRLDSDLDWRILQVGEQEFYEQRKRLAAILCCGEPSFISRFLEQFAKELQLHFFCPICKQLRLFHSEVRDSSFWVAAGIDIKPEEHWVKLLCEHCLKHNPQRCGGYEISWAGKGKRQRVMLMCQAPKARLCVQRERC